MASDLVERLRKPWDYTDGKREILCEEAAARIAALEAELAEAKAERDELDALYHEGGTWEQQLSAAEARATAAEARAEKMADALKKTRATFEVEYHKDGRVASVGHASDGLRKLVALLDAALGRPE